ncbi:hypothetical protein [Aquisalibacillus elongatus]|uniref:Uncharacterized protein n=1 Tax=Aquisalibacillus elongatus TaxID=485577 RepID=A0A3N5AZ76_9BACI|nr:hypothetical protein [Aquisalibacillus elongatus]RPF50253.1 hypothetical protein EDC24_2687 [Aquisalibacillus elongatus]
MFLIEKVFTSILSAFILAVILANDFQYFKPVFLISLPVFLIAGLVCTYITEFYVLDKINVNRPFQKYIMSLAIFGLGGMVAISLFALLQGNLFDLNMLALIIMGLMPAILYFHISLLIQFVSSKFIT